ncbi:MAG TPA: hypothetical protein VEH31_26335 [Streptosporangiaceae bacterium]|nr:hypothetical protein [Streptosporangiaceae bacterium]
MEWAAREAVLRKAPLRVVSAPVLPLRIARDPAGRQVAAGHRGGARRRAVASSLTTVSARDMIEGLIAGERDLKVLAGLARAGCVPRTPP